MFFFFVVCRRILTSRLYWNRWTAFSKCHRIPVKSDTPSKNSATIQIFLSVPIERIQSKYRPDNFRFSANRSTSIEPSVMRKLFKCAEDHRSQKKPWAVCRVKALIWWSTPTNLRWIDTHIFLSNIALTGHSYVTDRMKWLQMVWKQLSSMYRESRDWLQVLTVQSTAIMLTWVGNFEHWFQEYPRWVEGY